MQTHSNKLCYHKVAYKLTSLLTFATLLNFTACKSNDNITVTGDLLDKHSFIEGKMVYLGNEETKNFEDSAIVKDGKFELNMKPGRNFAPFRASLLYATGDSSYPYWIMGFKNPFVAKTFQSNFYVDRGTVNLVKDSSSAVIKKEIISFKFVNINEQTGIAFKNLDFKINPKNSGKVTESNRLLIRSHPNSIHLLRQLDHKKGYFNEAELRHLISLFDNSVNQSILYKNLVAYSQFKNNNGTNFPAGISLTRPDNRAVSSILDHSKYNLVVFWASWCGPCRQEIPQIKRLHSKYGDQLQVSSISIDKREDWWRKALAKENMPWDQFLLKRDSSFVKLDKKYNLNTIPVWLLFDSKNNLIDKQIGLASNEKTFVERISRHLTK